MHVRDFNLARASDEAIWEWAGKESHTIVTTDSDFLALSQRLGSPPKVIYLERCQFPFRVIEDLFRQNAVRISDFDRALGKDVLILRFPSAKSSR